MRLHMSRPMKSAPSRWSAPGGASEEAGRVVSGSWVASQGAKTAASTKATTMARPSTPSGWRRAWNRAAPIRPSTLAPARASAAPWSTTGEGDPATATTRLPLVRVPDARVERGVEHVHGEVHDHHHDGDEHHQVLHDRVVAPQDRLHQEAGDPGDVEDRLRHDQPADQ